MRVLPIPVLLLFCLTSCLNKAENGNDKDVNPEQIYYDYKVSAEEGREEVTVMLQYRLDGEDGIAQALEEPSKVSLDGTELMPDSAKLTGAFYEAIKPMEDFKGKHTIVFTDSRNKNHEEEFNFEPFTLASELPEQIRKSPFTIQLADIPYSLTRVHLVMIDTSYATADVNEEIVIEKGEIHIDEEKLANLSTGPVTLEIYREEKRPLKNASKAGGRILITYSLRRQFELVN